MNTPRGRAVESNAREGGPATPSERIRWPDGKTFAFTAFDDPDGQSLEQWEVVYSFLRDAGFRTTIGAWPEGPTDPHDEPAETCANDGYRARFAEFQQLGFEIGYHNATLHSSTRERTERSLETFKTYFGCSPSSMSNHAGNAEAIYWGPDRLSGLSRCLYQAATLGRNRGRFLGHRPGSPYFWGDLCRADIHYCRNFVYSDIDTLRACPWMPYHDPARPYVRAWFAGAEGKTGDEFVETIAEANQDRLEEEGGACIMYTHFGYRFVNSRELRPRFQELMTRLSRKNGWFVPVSTLLGYLESIHGVRQIQPAERRSLERRWLTDRIRRGAHDFRCRLM